MKRILILYTFVAALGGLVFGFDTAVINGALPFFTKHFDLSHAMQGWAVSSALIGCIIGALFIGRPGDTYGRRYMLKILAILFNQYGCREQRIQRIQGFFFASSACASQQGKVEVRLEHTGRLEHLA